MSSTVLLVADEMSDKIIDLADRVRDTDWSVAVVDGAERALEALRKSPATLMLVASDVWGIGAFRDAVGRDAPTLPVVVLTAGDEPSQTLVQHLKLGAATFVPRSSSKRELRATIRSIIDLSLRNPYRDRVRSYLRSGEVELQLENDLSAVAVVVGFLQSLMDGYHVGDEPMRVRLGVALSEAISNAMIHGNLQVSSELRLRDADEYFETIERKRHELPYAARKVVVHASFTPAAATFTVRDEGPGFNVADVPDPTDPANLMKPSGRGLLMMNAYTDTLCWNERGNEVTMVKKLEPDTDHQ